MLSKCIDRLVHRTLPVMITEILLVQFLCYGSAQVVIAEAVPLMSTEPDHGLTTAIRHDSVNKTKIPGTTILEGTNSLTNEGCTNDTKALKRHADYIEEHFIPVTPVC